MTGRVFHFSEDPSIERFIPHVPATNPTQPPAIWAIDERHAPLYWFPRACPRVTAWSRSAREQAVFGETFATSAHRVQAIEAGWLARMQACRLYAYAFAAEPFVPWPEAEGQWVAHVEVEPVEVTAVGDLIQRHVDAAVELRVVPSLWPLFDLAVSPRWGFSMVRMADAQPRPAPVSSG